VRGASRAALAATRTQLTAALDDGADPEQLADELFGVAQLLDSQPGLRRALTDPARNAEARSGLAGDLFGGRVSTAAAELITGAAGSRWSAPGDLGDATQELAVLALVAAADDAGRLDDLEDELFRFSRVVSSYPDLRTALASESVTAGHKRELLDALLGGKVTTQTLRLVGEAATRPRGRSLDVNLEEYARLAAQRRDRLTAEVHVALPLTAGQRDRLGDALAALYGHEVHLNVVLDPQIVGGMSVRIGDDLIDGTIVSRIDDLKRRLSA